MLLIGHITLYNKNGETQKLLYFKQKMGVDKMLTYSEGSYGKVQKALVKGYASTVCLLSLE